MPSAKPTTPKIKESDITGLKYFDQLAPLLQRLHQDGCQRCLAETVRATYYGQEVMRLQRGRHEVKLMVRTQKRIANRSPISTTCAFAATMEASDRCAI